MMKPELSSCGSHASNPEFSVIIECQNMILAELWRTRRMLQELSRQLLEMSETAMKPEVIVVYNVEETDATMVERVVNEELKSCLPRITLRIVPTSHQPYYELKNVAARHSRGDKIIFLDSDVIPEDGWLKGLIDAFKNPEVRLVGGANYCPSDTLYERAIGLIHYGPREESAGEVCEADYFPGGNLAFRRELFETFPFPPLPHFRGRWTLMRKVHERGIVIYLQPKSRASHPAPNGVTHFVRRAVCDGHDLVMDRKLAKESKTPIMKGSSPWSAKRKYSRFHERYRKVNFSAIDSVVASGIISAYLSLMGFGMLITYLHPGLVRRYFPI